MGDPLVPLPTERWNDLKNEFKKDYPRGISGCTVLDTEEVLARNNINDSGRIYCPFGNITNGFVRISNKPTYIEVTILCPKDDTRELEQALKLTKRIVWTRHLEIPFAPKHVEEVCSRVIRDKGLVYTDVVSTHTYYLDDDAPYYDVKLPPEFTFKLLSMEYAQIADETWPHRHSSSLHYFEVLIKSQFGYGLFVKEELVAWCFVKETGDLGHLYTLEKHRRKGYGDLVLKLISDALRKQGKYVLAFCVVGNEGAKRMYEKAGFKLTDVVDWCSVDRVKVMDSQL